MSALPPQSTQGISIALPCELPAVRPACQQVRAYLAAAGLSPDELNAWELAMAEGLNNAVLYVARGRQSEPVQLSVTVSAATVEVSITDHTRGFEFPTAVALPPPDAENGRGLFLILHSCDQVVYRRGRDDNQLVLRRARREPRPVPLIPESGTDPQTLELMTEELASAYESLGAVFRFSADLQTGGPHDSFIRKWMSELLGIAGADWYAFRLADAAQTELRLESSFPPGLTTPPLSLRAPPPSPVEVRATLERCDIWFDADNPLAPTDPLAPLAPNTVGFAHPIIVNDVLVGVLSLGRDRGKAAFKAGDINVVQTFADFIGIQLRNEQFHATQLQTQLIEREFELAGRVQRSLLPTDFPSLGSWQTIGHCKSARRVGGDFYDIVPHGNDGLLLAVADVMGKGAPAALFSAIFRTLLRVRTDLIDHPGELLAWLNRNLVADLERFDMFVSAMIAHFDQRNRTLRVAGAGHPPCLVSSREGIITELAGDSPPLGVVANISTAEQTLTLPPGARVLLYTDGFSEARNGRGDFLGMDPLKAWLATVARRGVRVEPARNELRQLVQDFEAGVPQTDDQAFILLGDEQ